MPTRTDILNTLAGESHRPDQYALHHSSIDALDNKCMCRPCWYERDHLRNLKMEQEALAHERALEKVALTREWHSKQLDAFRAWGLALVTLGVGVLTGASWLRVPLLAWAGVAALHVLLPALLGGIQ